MTFWAPFGQISIKIFRGDAFLVPYVQSRCFWTPCEASSKLFLKSISPSLMGIAKARKIDIFQKRSFWSPFGHISVTISGDWRVSDLDRSDRDNK